MRYFYCTVTLNGTPGTANYYYIVQAKNLDGARIELEKEFDFVSYQPISICIQVKALSSMFTDDCSTVRLYIKN